MINFDINKIKRLNLIRLMEERDISKAELAKLIEVSEPYINFLLSSEDEKKHRNLGEKTIKKICIALNISPREFYLSDELQFEKNTQDPLLDKALKKYKYLSEIKRRVELALERGLPEEVLYENIKAEMDAALREVRALKKEADDIPPCCSVG